MNRSSRDPGSFRDKSGFVFFADGDVFRRINISYKKNYDHLMKSGLYKELLTRNWIIPHKEVQSESESNNIYKTIKPDKVPFWSYPYEWSFTQLKDAALITLQIHQLSLEHGMVLKDATPYNIQFYKGRPTLVDTLSFEEYVKGSPWVAYRQFCESFLAPLSLMSTKDLRLNKLLRVFNEGIPLDLASKMLPVRSYFNKDLLIHVHLHNKSIEKFSAKDYQNGKKNLSLNAHSEMINSLIKGIKKINIREVSTEWENYYGETNYPKKAMRDKVRIVKEFAKQTNARTVWDFGANTGKFSRLFSEDVEYVASMDYDELAVDYNYKTVKENKEDAFLPLVIDITNPTPGIGWNNTERISLKKRGPVDLILFLALIHHLVITDNIPFEKVAGFLSEMCDWLIIEFPLNTDSNVEKIFRPEIEEFRIYNQKPFELAFKNYFKILKTVEIKDSQRLLYLMKNEKKSENIN